MINHMILHINDFSYIDLQKLLFCRRTVLQTKIRKSSNHHVYRRHSIQVLKPCSEQEKCLRRSRSVCSQNIFCGCNHRPSRLPQSVDTKNQKYRQPAKKSRPRPSMPQGNLSLPYPTILVSFPIFYFAQQGYSRGENYYFFREIGRHLGLLMRANLGRVQNSRE